jgi:hypothetical protein
MPTLPAGESAFIHRCQLLEDTVIPMRGLLIYAMCQRGAKRHAQFGPCALCSHLDEDLILAQLNVTKDIGAVDEAVHLSPLATGNLVHHRRLSGVAASGHAPMAPVGSGGLLAVRQTISRQHNSFRRMSRWPRFLPTSIPGRCEAERMFISSFGHVDMTRRRPARQAGQQMRNE